MKKESKCSAKAASCARANSEVLIALALGAVFLVLAVSRAQLTLAQETKQKQPQAASKARGEAEIVARGKYIVEGLAACGDCHTPRNSDGDIDRTKWLSGAPVFYEPAQRVPGWAITAPRIAGLPPGRDAEIITLLTTATWRDGKAPRPPMPRFHMKRADAEAVVAYLKSLWSREGWFRTFWLDHSASRDSDTRHDAGW
jgi:mono/diheme cytochrome c family protein